MRTGKWNTRCEAPWLTSQWELLVYDLKLNISRPLIVEIPDRHGNGRAKDSISRYVREAIGVKI